MKNNWFLTIGIAVVTAAAAFYGGMQYQKAHAATTLSGGQYMMQGGQGQGNARFGQRRGMGGATTGQVVGQDANSITIQLQDGSSKIVNISGSTIYSKSAPASESDIQTGTRIAAFGTPNSDGSIAAQNIQINPMMRTGGSGGGAGARQPSPTQ